MTTTPKSRQRGSGPRWVWGAGILLILYFVAVFLPLNRRVAALFQPKGKFQELEKRLADATHTSPPLSPVLFAQIEARLDSLRQATNNLQQTQRWLFQKIELDPETRHQLATPFQLIDFQNERLAQITQLRKAAQKKKISLEKAIESYPDYQGVSGEPRLLWVKMAALNRFLLAAVDEGVATVGPAQWLPVQTLGPSGGDSLQLKEIAFRFTVEGSMESIEKCLLSVTMTHEEMTEMKLKSAPLKRPILFLNQILVRKNSPRDANAVEAEGVLSAFVRQSNGNLLPSPVSETTP